MFGKFKSRGASEVAEAGGAEKRREGCTMQPTSLRGTHNQMN